MSPIKTAVKYNRKEKSWQALNGETHNFGSGKDAKRRALLAALEHDHPELHAVLVDVARMNGSTPAVTDRLLKGAQLLVRGRVFKTSRKHHYKVRSQSGSEVYKVDDTGIPRAYSCDCIDYIGGQQRHAGLIELGGVYTDFNPWPVCKHILAVHLAWLSQWPLKDQPIPF